MRILAIETSCDETAAAFLTFTGVSYTVTGENIHSQADIHAGYGGVYPTLAKREHQKILPLLVRDLLQEHRCLRADISVKFTEELKKIAERNTELLELSKTLFTGQRAEGIDALAVTQGPGLAPALWVGVTFTRILSLLWNIPLIPVNHMEGHIVSGIAQGGSYRSITYPLLALLVSGGHTELILAEQENTYRKIGGTLDDAAGEAFDKAARLLNLPYPGGPVLEELAARAREQNYVPPVSLPRPMLRDPSLNFSYAGLKTAVRVFLERRKTLRDNEKAALAMEFENAVVETLLEKTRRSIERYGPKTLVLGGGVSANRHLRECILALTERYSDLTLCLPEIGYATDNAVMIALAAYLRKDSITDAKTLTALPNLSFLPLL